MIMAMGKLPKELVVPLNKPVRLDLISEDVNHSLFIPAFRVKEDVVPGYDNFLWFSATYIGEYEILVYRILWIAAFRNDYQSTGIRGGRV